jgi:hypothetical protein
LSAEAHLNVWEHSERSALILLAKVYEEHLPRQGEASLGTGDTNAMEQVFYSWCKTVIGATSGLLIADPSAEQMEQKRSMGAAAQREALDPMKNRIQALERGGKAPPGTWTKLEKAALEDFWKLVNDRWIDRLFVQHLEYQRTPSAWDCSYVDAEGLRDVQTSELWAVTASQCSLKSSH